MSIHPLLHLAQLLRLFRKILDLKGRHSLLGFRRETRPPSKSWLSAELVAALESHPSFRITRLRSSQLCPSLWLPTSSSIFRPATKFQAMTNSSTRCSSSPMPTGVVTSPDLEIWAVNPLTMPRSATAALSEDLRLGGSSKPPGLSERNSAYLRALVGCSSWLQFWRKQYAVLEALGCRRSPCVQYHNRCREWCIGYMIRQRATSLDLDLNPNFSQARSIENVLTNTCLFTFPRRTRRRLEDLKFSHYGSQAPRHQETSVAGPELADG